jgi:hypothetical protein
VSKPGFEAELLALKQQSKSKVGVNTRAQSPALAAASLPEEKLSKQEAPSTFKQYYQQNFQSNSIPKKALEELYKSIVSKSPALLEASKSETCTPVKFHFKPSVGTWHVASQFKAKPTTRSQLLEESQPTNEEAPCVSNDFRRKASVGTWLLPAPKGMKEEVSQKPYVPRLQARNQEYLKSLVEALSGAESTVLKHEPYVPRLQARSHAHLVFLESALSGDQQIAECKPYAPRLQARSHAHLEFLEHALSTVATEHKPYVPRLQALSQAHLIFLESALTSAEASAEVELKPYAPRLQARSSAHLTFLESALRGDQHKDCSTVVAPYVPRLQASIHAHIEFLENALSPNVKEHNAYVPRLQARMSAHLEFLESALSTPVKKHEPYVPRLQARSHAHLEFIEQALSTTVKKHEPYVPRLQARSHAHLEFLESALTRSVAPETSLEVEAHKPYVPRLQAQSHAHTAFLEKALSSAPHEDDALPVRKWSLKPSVGTWLAPTLPTAKSSEPTASVATSGTQGSLWKTCVATPTVVLPSMTFCAPQFYSCGIRPMPFVF